MKTEQSYVFDVEDEGVFVFSYPDKSVSIMNKGGAPNLTLRMSGRAAIELAEKTLAAIGGAKANA